MEEIFGNRLTPGEARKSLKAAKGFKKSCPDDKDVDYKIRIRKNKSLYDYLGIMDIRLEGENEAQFDTEKGIIVSNIRMGFGHYRISMAMASAARALGYTPYWLDLNSFPKTASTKIITKQNDMYSLGSRLSKNPVFNKLVWEPVNYYLFKKLTYNASDWETSKLLAPVYQNIPKDIPVIATHAWPAQSALAGGMKHVVEAIPDNWPMALHLAEGAIHTIQTHNSYLGYRVLNGFYGKKVLNPIPGNELYYTGHYIDDELVRNIEADCRRRIDRLHGKKPVRFMLSIGGAGAQADIFEAILKYLMPAVKKGRASVIVNVGDYRNVWDELLVKVDGLKDVSAEHFENFREAAGFADDMLDADMTGVHAFYHKNIFEAVYITNLLMRACDCLITKPSELAFYPVPKLFIRRVGKHEMWAAIHSAELGDGTYEIRDIPHVLQMIGLMIKDPYIIESMCHCIEQNKSIGVYDGAYNCVKLAAAANQK
ncbi:MAG: hypothetical protein DUD27_02300 [Lachnospiraceae bacterium]|uniref:Glycosyltransferase family 4 protein n=1 Tax=Candidatus Weimeria bifida TaxID=2599074 RepID=A0A6N7J1T4_9FIRM|nr:hypothetical protein [Candidatus Weimeria bifida]RRF97089.1 MAG: hypothetical protein DUD27_02300 [Lachnospiraceae bacterium]